MVRSRVHGWEKGARCPRHERALFRKSDGRVLGAQAAGEDGVDKRISDLAFAIQMGATVYDLEQVELLRAAIRQCEGSDQLRGNGRRRRAPR